MLGPEGSSLFEDMDALRQDSRYRESHPLSLSLVIVVSQPMDFRTIEAKLQQGVYELILVFT